MSFASKHNKGGVIFDIDISAFKFKKLSDIFAEAEGRAIQIDGLYINSKSRFDAHPVAIAASDGILIDLPSHMTEEVKEILKDEDDINAIKEGRVGFTIDQYTDKKYGKTCYGVNWVDL